MAKSLHVETMERVHDTARLYPRMSLMAVVVVLVLAFTRFYTTLRYRSQRSMLSKTSGPMPPLEVPYGLPILGNAGMFVSLQTSLLKLLRGDPNVPCFTLNIAGYKHHIIASPSISHQMSFSRQIIPKLDMRLFVNRVMETFWNDGGTTRNSPDEIFDGTHKALVSMMHNSFMSVATPDLASLLSTNTADLISFSRSPVDQTPWERLSAVHTTSSTTATANLWYLIRSFISHLTTDNFFSPDLLANFPSLASDIFTHDDCFDLMVAGFPDWLPSLRPAARARDRVVEALRQHHIAYWKYHNGQDPGAMWSQINLTNKPIAERIILPGEKANDFSTDLPEHKRGYLAAVFNAAILWALQVNAPAISFWLIWHIYSDPELLREIREEIAPFISTEPPLNGQTGSGIREKPRLNINAPALLRNSKLLLGAFFETMRLETMSLTYKRLTDDVSVTESEADAEIYGRKASGPKTFVMKKGEFVCVPHLVHHRDGRWFPEPEVFDARRFWVLDFDGDAADTNSKDEGKEEEQQQSAPNEKKSVPKHSSEKVDKTTWPKSRVSLSYLTSHPWGGGAQMCKGRNFAEMEILLSVACIIHLWEFDPVEKTLFGGAEAVVRSGEWKDPGRQSTNASARPGREVRVRVRRREGVWG